VQVGTELPQKAHAVKAFALLKISVARTNTLFSWRRRRNSSLSSVVKPLRSPASTSTPPSFVDGRSLSPLLSASPPSSCRNALLVEHWLDENGDPYAATIPDYTAVRMGRYLFVRYATGEMELYDPSNDPYELQSLHDSASRQLKERLATRLDALEDCVAQSCRSAQNRAAKIPATDQDPTIES
jgi:hypothetical protein